MMFALEFLNFAYNVEEYASRSEVFYSSPLSVTYPKKGLGFGVATGTVPGDVQGGVGLAYPPLSFSFKLYRSGEIPITTLPDTTSPPSEDNPPEVLDRVRFSAYEGRFSLVKPVRSFRFSASVKVVFARAGSYGSGVGGGMDLAVLYPFEPLSVYLGLRDALSSPVVWSTGKKEFAPPTLDLRLKLRVIRSAHLLMGGTYDTDGRGFSPLRDGFLTLRTSFSNLDVYGGFVEGKVRLGMSYAWNRYILSLATSYHADFGYSFLGGMILGF